VSNASRDNGIAVAEPDSAGFVSGLECRIGKARIAVPTEAIARIVEYRTLPLPLAKPWIGGIGLHEGTPLVSVALRHAKDGARGATPAKGILLNVPTSPIGWVLEVEEVFVFVRAKVVDRTEIGNRKLPRWIGIAMTDEGRSLGWVNVAAMLADLAQVAPEAA